MSTDSQALPLQLHPVLRLAAKQAEVDLAQRLATCAEAVLPVVPPPDALQMLADSPPLTVPSTAEAVQRLTRRRREAVEQAAARMQERLHLAPSLGEVRRLELSCLATAQQGFEVGTVVLVRETDAVLEQYVFPLVRVDLTSGRMHVVEQSSPADRGVHAMGSGLATAREVIGVGMAVSPFLPPPYGAAVTGGLAVANFLLGRAEEHPSGGDPLTDLKQSLEDYIRSDDIREEQGHLRGVMDDFLNRAQAQDQPIESLTTAQGGIAKLKTESENWHHTAHDANEELCSILETCNTRDVSPCLDVLVSGITTELLLQNALVVIGAIEASVAHRQNDLDEYSEAVSRWTSEVGTTANSIGQSREEPWDPASIEVGLAATAYVPRIEAWMAKAKAERLAQVGPVRPFTYTLTRPAYGRDFAGNCETFSGWTWTDAAHPGDEFMREHLVVNTVDTSGCCAKSVEHPDKAQASHAAYLVSVGAEVDQLFAPYRKRMATWRAFIEGFHALMPPDAPPPVAKVRPKAEGPAMPRGVWVEGAQVRYAVTAVNAKGPSPASRWSAPLQVRGTAHATLTGLRLTPGAESLNLYRQVRPPGDRWGRTENLGAIPAPLPDAYDDVDEGGEDW